MSAPRRPLRSPIDALRREAKQLLRACRRGDPQALDRVRAILPGMSTRDDDAVRSAILLADVQHAIARERGHDNWAALKRHDDPIAQCLVAVRGGALARLAPHLAEFAPMVRDSIHVAAALGDRRALDAHLSRDPSSVSVERDGWMPLAYVCASPLHRLSARHSAALLECAEALLDAGADPNTVTPVDPSSTAGALTVVGRALLAGNTPVAVLLQRRGAAESGLRDVVTARMRDVAASFPLVEVVREFFRRPDVRASMQRTVDEWRVQHDLPQGDFMPQDLRELHRPKAPSLPGMTGLLALVASRVDLVADMASVAHRLVRSAPAELVDMALDRGLDVNVRDASGRTLLAEAIRAGNAPVVDLLLARGADPASVSAVDRWLGACVRLDEATAHAIAAAEPAFGGRLGADDFDVLVEAAATNKEALVRALLDAGMPPDGLNTGGATALHHAAWHGHPRIVRLLIDRGARAEIEDALYGTRPLDWAVDGATRCRDADDEYAAVRAALEGARHK
jgi:ankyrin repeat protein